VLPPTYRGFVPLAIDMNDRRFYVGVHLGLVDSRLVCVGIDFRSINLGELAGQVMHLGNGDWTEITTAVLRGLHLGEAVERALEQHRGLAGAEAHSSDDPDSSGGRKAAGPTRRPSRGPRPLLDDAMLTNIVVPAYQTGGRRPVQSVLEAMNRAGVANGAVTPHQASRAVARARARGFIPPTRTNRAPDEGDEA
jgi:hypothetical protein